MARRKNRFNQTSYSPAFSPAGGTSSGVTAATPILGGFTPMQLSGNVLTLDFAQQSTLSQDSAGTTPVASDGDVIGRAEEQSGEGNHATQTTTPSKPLWRSGGYAECDGVDDFLSNTSFSLTTVPLSLVVGFKTDGAISASERLICIGSGGKFNIVPVGSTQKLGFFRVDPGPGFVTHDSGVEVTGSRQVTSVRIRSMSDADMSVDGTLSTFDPFESTPTFPANYTIADQVGGGFPMKVHIYKIAIYDRALTTAELLKVEAWAAS